MRELLLSIVSPESLSWIGFVLLAGGLLGEVAVLIVPTERRVLHNLLGLFFAAIVLVGYVVNHIGDDESLRVVSRRAAEAEGKLKKIESMRVITPGEHTKIVNCLKSAVAKGPIFIRPGMIHPDAPQLGQELEKIFREAGGFSLQAWPAGGSLSWSTAGIFLVVTDLKNAPLHAQPIQRCFWEADIPIYGYPDPNHPADAVSVAIGPRL